MLDIVYYEPLERRPDLNRLIGEISINSKKIWFCMGLYPSEEEPYCYALTMEYDQDPVVWAEFDPEGNRFVISFNEVIEENYITVMYLPLEFDWKIEGF